MSTYFNHLRELAATNTPTFAELSHLSRAVAYGHFLADNADHFDDILVEPTNYLTCFRANLLTLLSSWDVDITALDADLILHLQAEFFVMCENSLMECLSDDYEQVRQNETYRGEA